MRRTRPFSRFIGYLLPLGILTVAAFAIWGVWTWRLSTANRELSMLLEAERQRHFTELAHHVEQIQSVLGKGLVTGAVSQNMRYLAEAHYHAMSAVGNFTSLPLPANVSAATGKFLKQTGDFALSIVRSEAAGRPMEAASREQLIRLREESIQLNSQLQHIMAGYSQGTILWNPPLRLSWSTLLRGPATQAKPGSEPQAPSSMLSEDWTHMTTTMEQLPVMIYDGPFSDHLADWRPATAGPPISRTDAEAKLPALVPKMADYRVLGADEVNGTLPAYSFKLGPVSTENSPPRDYNLTAEITRNGALLLQLLNSRLVGKPVLDLTRAKEIGQQYLTSIGYSDMAPTYGQVADGAATVAYAYQEEGVLIYPDQIKVKVALDNGEVLSVDARQFLMSHHPRSIERAALSLNQAEKSLNPEVTIQRTQLSLIPNAAGTGETLTYEFLVTLKDEIFLVYINAQTGQEEQILQQIEADGGTFTL